MAGWALVVKLHVRGETRSLWIVISAYASRVSRERAVTSNAAAMDTVKVEYAVVFPHGVDHTASCAAAQARRKRAVGMVSAMMQRKRALARVAGAAQAAIGRTVEASPTASGAELAVSCTTRHVA